MHTIGLNAHDARSRKPQAAKAQSQAQDPLVEQLQTRLLDQKTVSQERVVFG